MRPALLDPLFVPLTSLDGVGSKVASMIEKVVPADLGERHARAGDLLFLLPHGVIDRRNRPGIAYAAEGAIVTLEVRIDRHQPPPRGNRSVPYRVYAHDDTGEIALTFFHAHAAWLQNQMPEGAHVVVSGRMEWFNGRPTMVHPDHIAGIEAAAALPLVEPVYPLTAGLSSKVLRRAISQGLARLPALAEWLDPDVARRHSFPAFVEALARLHNPADPLDVSPEGAAWRRLAYDELLAGQLSLALVRSRVRRIAGRALTGDGRFGSAIRAALPYSLTSTQETALGEIEADLGRPERMLRLLQGDVGSG
ncbi:MAG: ATP-dependent DNA helicase RecG, partial [Aquamicrobium sp.]|nr:ATP-dependent DNA helicase RecG [Aquamicrobium sp.]